MLSIIIAFPREADAENIKAMLLRNGYDVSCVCTNGAQVVSAANVLDGGVVISGYRLLDMHYRELRGYLPGGFEMLLMVSNARLNECRNQDVICLGLPVKAYDLTNTLEMMTYHVNRQRRKNKHIPKERTRKEQDTILKAKALLMERNHMSEEDAYRYIQKNSMDSQMSLSGTAEMILGIFLEYTEMR